MEVGEAVTTVSSTLIGLPGDEIDGLWLTLEGFLEKALIRTGVYKDYSPVDLYDAIKAKDMQCWVVVRNDKIIGLGLTEILQMPQRKILAIPFLGMDAHTIKYWLHHLETIKEFGKYHGCSAIRGWGRAGWVRLLNPTAVRVEFDLEI